MTSGPDPAANLKRADGLVRQAAARGADLVVLPEKWAAIGPAEVLEASAEPVDGPLAQWARATASALGIDLVAGSFVERAEDGTLHNASLHVTPAGEVAAVYRKLHMFDVEVDGRAYRESDTERAGEEVVSSATRDGLGLGLSICYDLRFPELYRILALRGADIVVVPSAFTLPTTRDHWITLLRARAIENQVFVVAANQVGDHGGGLRSGGRSAIVDPWGVVLAQAGDRETVVSAELDLEGQRSVRRRLPVMSHRRPEAYRWPEEALR